MSDSLDAYETTVIGYMADDRFAREYALDHLTGAAFTSTLTSMLFTTMQRLHAAGRPVTAALLCVGGDGRRTMEDETWERASYRIVGLADTVAVDTLRERAQRRRIAIEARSLADRAEDLEVPLEAVRRWAVDDLALPPLSLPDPLPPLDDVVAAFADQPFDWLIPDVLERRDRAIFVAREGSGKSSLMRMIAYMGACGVDFCHPARRIDPYKTIILDAENSPRQTARASGRLIHCARLAAAAVYDPERVKLIGETKLDLNSPVWRDRIEGHLEVERPDLLIIGPIYKVFSTSSRLSFEENATRACGIIDDWRDRYGVTVVLEHHAPKGGDDDAMDPRGSAVWRGWPEFGHALARKDENDAFKVARFRNDREKRDFPKWWYWNELGSGWPWVPCHDDEPPRRGSRRIEVPMPPRVEARSFAEQDEVF